MRLRRRRELEAFTTLDGSEIREYAHTDEQSLAEATVPPSGATAAALPPHIGGALPVHRRERA